MDHKMNFYDIQFRLTKWLQDEKGRFQIFGDFGDFLNIGHLEAIQKKITKKKNNKNINFNETKKKITV